MRGILADHDTWRALPAQVREWLEIQEWRSRYPDHIGTGPYLNKELWSRIDLGSAGGPDDDEVRELIDDSYDLIVASLPKSRRP